MIKEIIGALEFVAFIGGLAWLCHIVERLPAYRRLTAELFPEDDE